MDIRERICIFVRRMKMKIKMKTTASEITDYMESLRDDAQRRVLMRFFKTGPGEYGEGDEFLVITGTVPLISSCDHFFSKALVK